jgi:hypothetical protein
LLEKEVHMDDYDAMAKLQEVATNNSGIAYKEYSKIIQNLYKK